MKPVKQCDTIAAEDLQLLLQFGIRQQVQIRLVKLKAYVHKGVKTSESETATVSRVNFKAKSSFTKTPVRIQIPAQNRSHNKPEETPKSHSANKSKRTSSHQHPTCTQIGDQNRPYSEETPKQFKCHLCKYSGAKQKYLQFHLKTHSDRRPFKCNLCNYIVIGRYYFNQHLRTLHRGDKPHICQFCTNGFIRSCVKNAHEKRCAKNPNHDDAKWLNENKRHKCHLCPSACWSAADLRVHLRRHLGQKPFQCKLCTYKSSNKSQVHRHIATHTQEKPFKCLECDFSTAVNTNLKMHIKRRHSNKILAKQFSCNLCLKNFYSTSHLYTHILRHTGETPFVCQFCKKEFNVNSKKIWHEKVCKNNPNQKDKNWVKDQKGVKCELCPYTCFYKSSLTKHLESHSGLKPLHCAQCSFRCTSSSNLTRHSQLHGEVKQFKCGHCNYECGNRRSLKKHISCSHTDIW